MLRKTTRFMALVAAGLAFSATALAADVLIEAESFNAQGGGNVAKVTDRPATSGGAALMNFDNEGHWLEWKIDVPADGNYAVSLRYAGGRKWNVFREVQIDGKVPNDAFAKVTLPTTGGFGRAEAEWKDMVIVGADGKAAMVALTKGTHVLRITNLGGEGGASGSANLDVIKLSTL
ncbi:MAG: carbohydrate-binding protein [Rhodocyclaceae bacterium]